MKVIDAHTGSEVHVGDKIPMPHPGVFSTPESSMHRVMDDYYYVPLAIKPGWFKASMTARMFADGKQQVVEVPLTVRWMHPGFPGQRVAFVPS